MSFCPLCSSVLLPQFVFFHFLHFIFLEAAARPGSPQLGACPGLSCSRGSSCVAERSSFMALFPEHGKPWRVVRRRRDGCLRAHTTGCIRQAPRARSCGVCALLLADTTLAAVSWGVCEYELNKVRRKGIGRDEGASEVLGSFPSSAFCGQKEGQGGGGSEGQQGRKIGWEVLPRPRLGG